MGLLEKDGVEWMPFGEQWCRRAHVDDEWESVPLDDMEVDTLIDLRVEQRLIDERRARGPIARPARIVRADANDRIARALGFTGNERDLDVKNTSGEGQTPTPADVLAQRLQGGDTRFGSPLGAETRVSEEEFDAFAVELGLDPQEMRDRFAGRHGEGG